MKFTAVSIPRSTHFGAGFLASALVLGSVLGGVWGLFRPKLVGRPLDDGSGSRQVAIENLANTQFFSFAWFVVFTGGIAVLLGFAGYAFGARHRGVAMLLWVGIVSLATAAAFYVCGSATAGGYDTNSTGQVTWVPPFNPGVGLVVSPLLSMTAYWASAFSSGPKDWER